MNMTILHMSERDGIRRVSPLTIEILMHCYTTPTPIHNNVAGSAQREIIDAFLELKLVKLLPMITANSLYTLTPKGKLWLDAILATPIPEECPTCKQVSIPVPSWCWNDKEEEK